MRLPYVSVYTSLAVALLLLAGCGPSNELGRLPFSGTVTLNGKPLKHGSISFTAVEASTKKGTSSGATITDGKFSVEALKGLPAGKYVVRIHSAGKEPAKSESKAPGEIAPPAKELIPPKWNANSQETREIKQGEENHFTFKVTTGG